MIRPSWLTANTVSFSFGRFYQVKSASKQISDELSFFSVTLRLKLGQFIATFPAGESGGTFTPIQYFLDFREFTLNFYHAM